MDLMMAAARRTVQARFESERLPVPTAEELAAAQAFESRIDGAINKTQRLLAEANEQLARPPVAPKERTPSETAEEIRATSADLRLQIGAQMYDQALARSQRLYDKVMGMLDVEEGERVPPPSPTRSEVSTTDRDIPIMLSPGLEASVEAAQTMDAAINPPFPEESIKFHTLATSAFVTVDLAHRHHQQTANEGRRSSQIPLPVKRCSSRKIQSPPSTPTQAEPPSRIPVPHTRYSFERTW